MENKTFTIATLDELKGLLHNDQLMGMLFKLDDIHRQEYVDAEAGAAWEKAWDEQSTKANDTAKDPETGRRDWSAYDKIMNEWREQNPEPEKQRVVEYHLFEESRYSRDYVKIILTKELFDVMNSTWPKSSSGNYRTRTRNLKSIAEHAGIDKKEIREIIAERKRVNDETKAKGSRNYARRQAIERIESMLKSTDDMKTLPEFSNQSEVVGMVMFHLRDMMTKMQQCKE